jgi:hypothetical protein
LHSWDCLKKISSKEALTKMNVVNAIKSIDWETKTIMTLYHFTKTFACSISVFSELLWNAGASAVF